MQPSNGNKSKMERCHSHTFPMTKQGWSHQIPPPAKSDENLYETFASIRKPFKMYVDKHQRRRKLHRTSSANSNKLTGKKFSGLEEGDFSTHSKTKTLQEDICIASLSNYNEFSDRKFRSLEMGNMWEWERYNLMANNFKRITIHNHNNSWDSNRKYG